MLKNNRLLAFMVLLFLSLVSLIYGKEKRNENSKVFSIHQNVFSDTTKHSRYLNKPETIPGKFIGAKSDSCFTYKKYIDFLNKISDTSKYIVLPLSEFIKTNNPNKIVIGLRHDIDLNLNIAYNLSKVENNVGFQSSYYILHTADYYLENQSNKAIHTKAIIPILKKMQNDFHHEIGWHNDLITLQLIYKIDPRIFLHQELTWLKNNGINVTGTASHGSNFCHTYHYVNWYFWKEFPNPNIPAFNNYESAIVGVDTIFYKKALLKDFGLAYEAYFINFNKYFSDASFVNSQRWNFNMLDLNTLHPGDRVQILMHPIYYSSIGSNQADLLSFNLKGQSRTTLNEADATIVVEMPVDVLINNPIATFALSAKANAYIGRRKLVSGVSTIDITKPLKLKVVAEDGLTSKDWTITIIQQPASAGLISGDTAVCQGQNLVTYTVPIIRNANTYKWTLPVGASGSSTTNRILVDFGFSAHSGNITVNGSNLYGDGAESTLNIVVKAKPATPTIIQNENILLSDAIIGNQWYNQNGFINGAVNQLYPVLSTGDYHVTVTAQGCSSEPSNSINVVITGTELTGISRMVKVYPNPVLDKLIIGNEGSRQQISFQVLNISGQVVYRGKLIESTIIQTSNFAPGLYIIKLENGKTFEFLKILKE